MFAAAHEGHDSAVALLVALGADVRARALNGATAIRGAAANGHDSTIKLLAGVAPDHETGSGGLSRLGLSHNGTSADRRIQDHVSACDNEGFAALHVAAQNGHDSTVRLLTDLGAGECQPGGGDLKGNKS